MKKTLIAIAALAATGAFAQSTVTIDGLVDAGFVSYDMKGTKASGVDRNLTSTSGINFRVNSDLGGGMRATWRGETNFSVTTNSANTGTAANGATNQATTPGTGSNGTATSGLTNGTAGTFLNGEQKLSLSGSLGEVSFGAINNTALAVNGTSQPFGTAIGSGFIGTVGGLSGSATTANVRNDNTLQFTTTPFAGGLKLNMIHRKAQGGTASSNNANFNAALGTQQQASVFSLAAMYNAGPLNVVVTRDVQDATGVNSVASGTGVVTAGARGTYTGLAANYNFGAATVYGGWQQSRAVSSAGLTTTDRSTVTLAAKYDMGVNTFMVSTQRAAQGLPTAVGGSSSALFALGYEYALSKTSALTARYERIGDGAGFVSTVGYAAATTQDRTRMGVGLRVGF